MTNEIGIKDNAQKFTITTQESLCFDQVIEEGQLRIAYGTDQLARYFLQFNPLSVQLDDECPQFLHSPLVK